MEADQVNQPPSVRQRVSPRYPRAAERDHVTGHVTLRVLVGRDGRVERVELLEACPARRLRGRPPGHLPSGSEPRAEHQGEPVRLCGCRKRLNFKLRFSDARPGG